MQYIIQTKVIFIKGKPAGYLPTRSLTTQVITVITMSQSPVQTGSGDLTTC